MVPTLYIVSGCTLLPIDQYRFLFSMASARKQSQADRFLKQEDANRSLIAESILKYAIQKATSSNSGVIDFNKFGKPFLSNIPLHFNISHSGNYVVCAISQHKIGIDIEKIDEIDNEIAERFFSPIESQWIQNSASKVEFLDRFFRIWVLKESYIKAIGTGLSLSLASFSVISENGDICRIYDSKKRIDWTLRNIEGIDSYHCAFCTSNVSQNIESRTMTVSDLCAELRYNTFSLTYGDKFQTEVS